MTFLGFDLYQNCDVVELRSGDKVAFTFDFRGCATPEHFLLIIKQSTFGDSVNCFNLIANSISEGLDNPYNIHEFLATKLYEISKAIHQDV
jgi:hypothetical protein